MLKLNCHLDPGPREYLEDAVAAIDLGFPLGSERSVYVLELGDGVGGQNAGEIASRIAARSTIAAILQSLLPIHQDGVDPFPDADRILKILVDACLSAHHVICSTASESQEFDGMASTVVIALVIGKQLCLAWAGDSRAFLIRGGEVKQLTRDHSEVQRLVDAGVISINQAATHPLRHVIYSCLGLQSAPTISTAAEELRDGDRLLLCSDGLSDVLSYQQIGQTLLQAEALGITASQLPTWLVQVALEAGTTDNTSVLIADYSADSNQIPNNTLTAVGTYPVRLAQLVSLLQKENGHVAAQL